MYVKNIACTNQRKNMKLFPSFHEHYLITTNNLQITTKDFVKGGIKLSAMYHNCVRNTQTNPGVISGGIELNSFA